MCDVYHLDYYDWERDAQIETLTRRLRCRWGHKEPLAPAKNYLDKEYRGIQCLSYAREAKSELARGNAVVFIVPCVEDVPIVVGEAIVQIHGIYADRPTAHLPYQTKAGSAKIFVCEYEHAAQVMKGWMFTQDIEELGRNNCYMYVLAKTPDWQQELRGWDRVYCLEEWDGSSVFWFRKLNSVFHFADTSFDYLEENKMRTECLNFLAKAGNTPRYDLEL